MPVFGSNYLKEVYSCFLEATKTLISKWEQSIDDTKRGVSNDIDVRDEMTRITLDIISESAFSYKLNALMDPKGKMPNAVTTVLHETGNLLVNIRLY